MCRVKNTRACAAEAFKSLALPENVVKFCRARQERPPGFEAIALAVVSSTVTLAELPDASRFVFAGRGEPAACGADGNTGHGALVRE